jgi:hypothetical protein
MSQLGVDLNSQQQVSIVAPAPSDPPIDWMWTAALVFHALLLREEVVT